MSSTKPKLKIVKTKRKPKVVEVPDIDLVEAKLSSGTRVKVYNSWAGEEIEMTYIGQKPNDNYSREGCGFIFAHDALWHTFDRKGNLGCLQIIDIVKKKGAN